MSEPIRKTLETDSAVREASFSGVIAYLLLRHGSWMNVTDAHQQRGFGA